MEGRLVDNDAARAIGAVPAHAVERVGRTALLDDHADCIGEADGVVRRVGGEEEHVALADDDVSEVSIVYDLENHGALVLVEVLGGGVDVVICAGVGAANNLQLEC